MNDETPRELIAPETPPRADDCPDPYSQRLRMALRSPLTWLALLIVYVLYSRIWDLSVKVMHHDESLFAYYGYWLYRGNGYHYQPILHGPVLQFLSAFFFLLFGDDQWTMRFPALVGGLLMFPVAWYWRRYIGGMIGVVAVTALIAFSPSIAFYTRFLRNDVPYLTATIWCALCLLRAMQTARPKYVWGALMAAVLMFSMMESSIFFFAACIGYLATMVLVDLLIWQRGEDDHTRRWPEWLSDSEARWRARLGSRPESNGRGNGVTWLVCWVVSLLITAFFAWLFHRVFYSTLHIYVPVQDLLQNIHLHPDARTTNILITACAFVGVFLLSLLAAANIRRPGGRYGLLGWFCRVVWINRWHVVAALAVAVIIYTTLFTTFFTFTKTASFSESARNFSGPEKALTPVQIYQNTWDYWWDQHKQHRIKGPFHYYLPILLLYELPILLLCVATWFRAIRDTMRPWTYIAVLLSMHLILALTIWRLSPIDWPAIDKKFHLESPTHFFLILLYAQLLVYIAPMMFRQGRRAESFITYWGVTSLFAYSYAGEKVPWLTIHTVGPLALLAAAEAARLWRNRVYHSPRRAVALLSIAGVAIVYQAHNNHLLLFVHPWSPAERLVYNHTSPDLKKAVRMIHHISQITNFGNQLPVYMEGEMGWPLHWYLREYNNIAAPVGETAENTTRPVVMVNWDAANVKNLRAYYTIRRMKVREWWEPNMLDFSAMSDIAMVLTPKESREEGNVAAVRYNRALGEWRKLWHYLAYREIWIDPNNAGWSNGDNEFAFCVRKDIDQQLMNYNWLDVTPKRPDVPVFIPY